MPSQAGDELTDLENRQEPRLVRALEMVAPGTALREGLDNILNARTGALLAIGDSDELSFLYSGGIKLDIDYTPALLYQVAKMDGAFILNANGTKICWANVQLMPDPTIMSLGGAVPGAGLERHDRRVRHQLHVGPADLRAVRVEDDRPVHLRDLVEQRGRVVDVELDPAGVEEGQLVAVADREQRSSAGV